MRLTLKIDGKGAAFATYPQEEMANLLRVVVARIEAGETYGGIRDTNGNTCGEWALK